MMDPSIQIVYPDPGGEGYHCVYYMARLAAELFNAELIVLKYQPLSLMDKLSGMLPPRKHSDTACLLICPSPTDLNSILFVENWRKRYGRLVAWVFDSFWTTNIPRWVESSRIFDHVFVTEQEDLETWRRKMRAPVDWLPWGSDVLNLGSPSGDRSFDVLRFGRQPADWEDDESNRLECQARNLRFHGRPPSYSDASDNERGLMRLLGETRFTLAFTNRVSRSIQTHPGREYITGRWTDSLAAGATVAGIPPRSESVTSLLWPEALLDLGTVDRAEGLEVLSEAVRIWTPEVAQRNYIKSLEHLDWRWRFKAIAEKLQAPTPRLDEELTRLSDRIQPALPVNLIGLR